MLQGDSRPSGPPRSRARLERLAVVVAALGATAVYGLTWLAAWGRGQDAAWGELAHALFGHVCHQNPDRSLAAFGSVQAVCGRCSGLYLGGAIGLIVGIGLARRVEGWSAKWFLVGIAPTGIDAVLPWVGLPQLTTFPRMLLATTAGVTAGLFLVRGVTDLVRSWGRSRQARAVEWTEVEGSHG